KAEIYVRPFPPTAEGGKWMISADGGTQPRWSHDGKEIYYLARDGRLMAVPIGAKGNTITAGVPAALFQTHLVPGSDTYDVAPDGRFLMNVTNQSASSLLSLILNWKPKFRP